MADPNKCGASTVEARKDLRTGMALHPHAGTISHICVLAKEHGAKANASWGTLWCKCACEHQWKKIG